MVRLIALAAALGLAGCASVAPQPCAPGLRPMIQAQLFFGRDIMRRGMVNEDEWRRFLDEEVTPRFPDGFSVADIDGQWRNRGAIIRERSKQLLVILSSAADNETKLNAIRDAYKRRFMQEAVLLAETSVCAAF